MTNKDADAFIARVMKLWDQGLNTQQIADHLKLKESIIARTVRVGREERRTADATRN